MPAWGWAIVVVAVAIVIALAIWQLWMRQRTKELQERFGYPALIDGFDKALYGNGQFIRIHRFYSACLEARLERTHTVFSGAKGRQRNGRDVSAFFSRQRAYFSHERITVFLRHYDISDQNIKTLVRLLP